MNIAYAYPFEIKDGNYHFNVHPHKIYDWQSRLRETTEKYLNDPYYSSVIFLETGNRRGDLVNVHKIFDNIDYKLPETKPDTALVNVPLDVPLVVSPAGNNRFEIKAVNEINITFTGGNHNYCIWNVTRHVIENLMNSLSEAKVKFSYDTKSIVAQPRGIEGLGIDFNKREINRSNLLHDLLKNKSIQARYHSEYLRYFKDYIGKEYSGMYRTYKINYKAEGFEADVVLEGQGHKSIEISFSYF